MLFRSAALVLAIGLASAGCAAQTTGGAPAPETSAATPNNNYPVAVRDRHGEIVIKHTPEKVVVLDLEIADYVENLGFGQKIVGVPSTRSAPTILEFLPAEVKKVGSANDPDLKKIAELEPDVILATERAEAHYDELKKIAPTVEVQSDSGDILTDTGEKARFIATVFGVKPRADEEIAVLQERMKTIKQQITAADKTAMFVVAEEEKITAYGPGSRLDLPFELGFRHLEEKKTWEVSEKDIARANPDFLFVLDGAAATGAHARALDTEEIEDTTAAREGHIIYLNPADWYLVNGGLTTLNAMIDTVANAAQH